MSPRPWLVPGPGDEQAPLRDPYDDSPCWADDSDDPEERSLDPDSRIDNDDRRAEDCCPEGWR